MGSFERVDCHLRRFIRKRAHMRDGKELIQNEGRDEKEKEEEEEVVEGISR